MQYITKGDIDSSWVLFGRSLRISYDTQFLDVITGSLSLSVLVDVNRFTGVSPWVPIKYITKEILKDQL